MLQGYSENITLAADSPVQFNNITLKKGCTVVNSGTATFELNKRGVYMVSVDAVAAAETTLQLYRDGVPMPQAQSTGTTLGFKTLVQVDRDNSKCCCSSPVTLQVMNTTAGDFPHVNVVITKLC